MCGICGFVNFDRRRPADRGVLEAMNRSIVHRGPDEGGLHLDGNLGIAMRRLRIIDLSTGQQPLSNEDGTVWIVYNGEIYKHLELRRDLEARGHRYRTRSDTETIVHLYEEYGPEGVDRLRGMFAFAIWDARRRRLFAARDPLGIKPFYYRRDGDGFTFGSEIKAILAHPQAKAELDTAVLPEYLAFGYVSSEATFFRGIRKLMPGHRLLLEESGALAIERYWDLPAPAAGARRPRSFYVRGYRDRLEQAVRSHLMSDVPLGVFLSGGLDSSAVAALTTRLRGEAIETFSVGYEESAYSELPFAQAVARHIGSVHHEVRVSRRDFFDALPRLVWHEDEPVCWTSSVALYHVARLAKRHVTVVLTGEGSDETLAGYTRYAVTRWNRNLDRIYRGLVPGALRRELRKLLASPRALGAAARRRLRHTFLAADGGDWSAFYFDNFYSAFSAAAQAGLLAEHLRPAAVTACENSLRYWEESRGPLIRRLLDTDIKTYLIELLMKQDNVSMAASLESRVPFLDRDLVEFALHIPPRDQVRRFAGKIVLKEAAADLLPASIIHRRKMGFPTPWERWLRGPALDEMEALVCGAPAQARGLFDPDALRRLFAEHRSGREDHHERIWRLVNLEFWHRIFIDRDPAYVPEPGTGVATAHAGR